MTDKLNGCSINLEKSNSMTNRILTALSIRIGGIFLFIKIFDHFGSYFFSIYSTAMFATFDEQLVGPIDKFYFTGTFMTIANILISLLLFLKADWIAKRLIKTDKEILMQLNANSLSKVILMTVGIVWLAQSIYLIPDFMDYWIELYAKLNGNDQAKVPNISVAKYILRLLISLILIFRIEKVSSWITKRV